MLNDDVKKICARACAYYGRDAQTMLLDNYLSGNADFGHINEERAVEQVESLGMMGLNVESGRKDDTGKPLMSLVPRGLIEGAARGMGYGKTKYGQDNWRKGFADSRLLDAVLRHVVAYVNGERRDPESGLCHLDHAACGLGMVMDQLRARANGEVVGKDDVHCSSELPHDR